MMNKGEKTKEKIITSALKLFGENGFAATSVQMIADDCKLTQSGVFQHFKNKELLLDSVRASVSKSNHEYVDSRIKMSDDGLAALKKHCVYNVEWALLNKEKAQIIVLTYYYAMFDEFFKDINVRVVALGTGRVQKYLMAGEREKVITLPASAEETASIVHEHLLGCFIRTLSASTTKSKIHYKDHINQFLDKLLTK